MQLSAAQEGHSAEHHVEQKETGDFRCAIALCGLRRWVDARDRYSQIISRRRTGSSEAARGIEHCDRMLRGKDPSSASATGGQKATAAPVYVPPPRVPLAESQLAVLPEPKRPQPIRRQRGSDPAPGFWTSAFGAFLGSSRQADRGGRDAAQR